MHAKLGVRDQPDIAFLVVDVVIHNQVPELSQALIVFCGARLPIDTASQDLFGRGICSQYTGPIYNHEASQAVQDT